MPGRLDTIDTIRSAMALTRELFPALRMPKNPMWTRSPYWVVILPTIYGGAAQRRPGMLWAVAFGGQPLQEASL